jgi:hypothetical protein
MKDHEIWLKLPILTRDFEFYQSDRSISGLTNKWEIFLSSESGFIDIS